MAAPPPTVHGTSRVEAVTSPIPKSGVASSSSQVGLDANSAQSVAPILEEKKQEVSNLNEGNVDPKTGVTVNNVFEMAKLETEIMRLEELHQSLKIENNVDPEVLKAAESLAPGQSTDSVRASSAKAVANVDPHAQVREKYNATLAKHQAILTLLVLENSNPIMQYHHLSNDQTKIRHFKFAWHNMSTRANEFFELWENRNIILRDYAETLSASEKELLTADRDYYLVQHERFKAHEKFIAHQAYMKLGEAKTLGTSYITQ